MLASKSLVLKRLEAAMPTWRQVTGVDLAFAGVVDRTSSSLHIRCASGAKTQALTNLNVRVGTGLGGKAVATSRPVSVTNYEQARGITHHYDRAARSEGLVTVAAFPIIVRGASRAIVYAATTAERPLGDRWFEAIKPLRNRLQHEILVEDEVEARMAQMAEVPDALRPSPSRDELIAVLRDLGEVAAELGTTEVSARLGRIRQQLVGADAVEHGVSLKGDARLTRRELQVLVEAARGLSNRQIAETLGLLPNTVKSYLQNLLRKLECSNRVQAIAHARNAGWIS